MAYWQPIRGIVDPISIREFAGTFKPDDEGFSLPETVFTDSANLSPLAYPSVSVRPGYIIVGTFGTRVLGMGVYKNTELHVVFNDGTWRRLNADGTWTTLASGLSTTAEWSFCNFQGNLAQINLIGANGVDAIKRYDGTTVQDLLNAPAGGNYIETQANRLYCAVGNIVNYSALRKADDWATVKDAGQVVIETNNGELINGLRAGNQHVTIFKPSSVHELYGTGPSNYRADDAALDIGAASSKSGALFDDRIFFIGREFLFAYNGGVRPTKDFSVPMFPYIRGMNKTQLAKCVSGSDGKRIYFGIPSGSATEVDKLLQFDPQRNAWYVWENIAAVQMVRMGADFYIGDTTGRVLKMSGTTDNGTAIAWRAATKPFTARNIARNSNWYRMWVTVDLPVGSTLNVYVSGKSHGEDWQLVKTLTASADIQSQPIHIPVNMIANAKAVRVKLTGTGPMTLYELARQTREMPMTMR